MQNAKLKFKIQNLRKRYPKFIYRNYSYKIIRGNLKISFLFEVPPGIKFRPEVIIRNIPPILSTYDIDRFDNLIFNLGLMEIPSYWKAACSPEIEIQAGYLNRTQTKWWKDLIIKGMGQFFYENEINFTHQNFLKIKSNVTKQGLVTSAELQNRVLVPVGGGKDSVVTLESLKKAEGNIQCFSLNPTGAALKIMKIADCKNPIIVKRIIDPKLLGLNRQGFLNGHTPFSAYLAFLSVLIAAIFNYKYIAFSNERSSNEGNVKYLGKVINHQWSKSFEFEQKFRKYSKKYLAPSVEYFSFLRPLYEIQIAKLFPRHPKYFNAFLSCNVAYQTASGTKLPAKKWCGNCPKCLFIFAALYPFVNEKVLIKIFGQNLFENRKLLPIMKQLLGREKFKPFECVGTKKESRIAFYLSWKKYTGQTRVNLPILLRYFEEKILNSLPRRISSVSERFLRDWNNQHNLSKEFEKTLKTYLLKEL